MNTASPDQPGISRVVTSRLQTRITYDRLSKWYNLLSGPAEAACRQAGLQKLGARPGEVVLEIGHGPGEGLLALARSVGEAGSVHGIDLSPGMSRVAQSRLAGAALLHRARLTIGDATRLPYAPACFDAIFMSFTLELFDTPEIPLVLGECARVLRHGGRVCVVGLSKGGQQTAALKLYEWCHDRFPEQIDCRPIFVRQAVQSAGLQVSETVRMSLVRLLPVEIVLARA
jgi:ubiquinone/menaquinone biosynthesis C-methylase UbiE